jgi:hypothetical protein
MILFSFFALFIQISFSYMFDMYLIFNPDIEETNVEAYAFLMPLYFLFIMGLFPIAISSVFPFFLSLNKTILFESIGLSFLVTTMILPLVLLPFELISPYLEDIFSNFIFPSILSGILIFLIIFKIKPDYKGQAVVRKTVLSFSTKHSDFKLYKLAKLCSVDKDFIKSVVKKMIQNNEIYAEYFNNTQKFAFNIKANVEEIDKLMALYDAWEIEHVGKQL